MMDHASVSDRNVRTTSGRTTSSRTAYRTAAPSACWSCSTSSRAAVWRCCQTAQIRRRAPLDLFVTHGPPEHIRSDNGPEFVAINVREWLGRIGVKTLYIEPGSPWENGYCESLNSKLRDELLNGEIFTTMREAQVPIENWRRHYNAIRPHSSLGYRPPAQRRSCRQRPVCLTLRFGQPRRWPTTAGF